MGKKDDKPKPRPSCQGTGVSPIDNLTCKYCKGKKTVTAVI